MAGVKQFSAKQKTAMTWWANPRYQEYDAIICDGAVRSGKTLSMGMGFFLWAMRRFSGEQFALCGKTIVSLRRNVLHEILPKVTALGFHCEEKRSENLVVVRSGGRENRFYLFGGYDEGSAALIQGVTLAGVLFDEAALMPRSFVEQASARCSVSGSKLWFNCNPEGPMHWFYLKGYAYMLRGGENDALIAQIEGGIKKEVSVGCSVERCVCSICGEDINTCAHKKGEVYGGKVCCAELVNAQDAYEWSFVAVPAQPRAGVLKRCGGEDAGTLKTLVKRRGSRANQRELESLEKQAEVGKRYLSELRGEVKRLMLVCEQEADGEAIEKLAEKLDESELKEMEKLYRGKMAKKLGLRTQLTYGEKTKAAEDESDFRV